MRTGPAHKTHCKRGHEFTEANAIQLFKNGIKNGRRCRKCHNERVKKNALEDKNGTFYRNRTHFQLRSRYGIESLEEREALLTAQDNKCAICGTDTCTWGKGFENKWHIDHKHDGTANHRGILCSRCNLVIGKVNDDPDLLEKMAKYLRGGL
jgi:hypothetical protein